MANPVEFGASEHAAPDCETVTLAEANFVGSLTEVALTTPIPTFVAVNIPLASIVPTAPVAVQVTPEDEPDTLAVNCCFPPTLRVMLTGLTETETPPPPPPLVTVTEALAFFVGSSTEVAVTVPVPTDTAVKRPLALIVPTLVEVQVTP